MQRNRVTAIVLASLVASPAAAGVKVVIEEVGNDVVITGDGTLDLSLWSSFGSNVLDPGIDPDIIIGIGPSAQIDIYFAGANFAGPGAIGTGPAIPADINSGDTFAFDWANGPILAVPLGYTSGSPLSGSSTYLNHSFTSLGVVEGSYTWTWDTAAGGSDFFTINVGNVPAPGALGLLSVAGLLGRRRRRAS